MKLDFWKYRHISIFIYTMIALPFSIKKSFWMFILSVIIFIISTVVSRLYRCPYCDTVFDLRLSRSKLECCIGCGKNLQFDTKSDWSEW